ncbi:threonine dehydratase [Pestalotiopsis sp. NC0098]|nr:threonine dehydratase [Pestalotiopsis sp. NC0098]
MVSIESPSIAVRASAPQHSRQDYVGLVENSHVYEVISPTPLSLAIHLSRRADVGRTVLLKREDTLPIFSFKLRGAYNKLRSLGAEGRRGVITCSAGNHGQGVAFSAGHLQIPSVIVMPQNTPQIKLDNVARLGGQVVVSGHDFDAAQSEAQRMADENNLTYIPPFDDPYVIAGQGTIGKEIIEQVQDEYDLSNVEAILCSVGGGGLIAGVGAYVKSVAPHVRIVGVQPENCDAMSQSLALGKPLVLETVDTFADGVAVRRVGRETFRLAREVVDEMILVSTQEICQAIKEMHLETRSILEPAGALPLAGLTKYARRHPPPSYSKSAKVVVCVTSGANMDFEQLQFAISHVK